MFDSVQVSIAQAIYGRDHVRVPCPNCSPMRKKKSQPCLSIDREPDGAVVYHCWHCTLAGAFKPNQHSRNNGAHRVMTLPKEAPQAATANANVVPLNQPQLHALDAAYLVSRGLSEATQKAAGLFSTKRFFPSAKAELGCIAFPYKTVSGHAVAHKYRTPDKHFVQDGGGAASLYGIERLNINNKTLVITEGEIDALSVTEAGFDNALSVPNGAPMKVANRRIDPSEDGKFAYIWEHRTLIDKMDRIVLATDADAQGEALREELARRIGKHKCWIVAYPEGCKDANDTLRKHGKVALSDAIIDAKPYPISALYAASEFKDDIETLYNKRSIRGASTGFAALDSLYTVYPGQVTIVTGFPSMGKSSFVDQMCVNLANQFQWKTAFCSFENTPPIHIAHLMELKIGKPFFHQQHGQSRIDQDEYKAALEWIEKHFGFIDFRDTEPPTIENILSRAQAAVQRLGVRGLVIDPYNYVRLERASSETDEISNMLTRVQAFAKANDCHVWFVAHPQKVYGVDSSFTPGGGNVSGSAAWWAKADCGLTVHRGNAPGEAILSVWKVRYRWIGQQGRATLSYEPLTGGFSG